MGEACSTLERNENFGFCEHGNELFRSHKGRKKSRQAVSLSASQGGH
jgi:hypothetical protein